MFFGFEHDAFLLPSALRCTDMPIPLGFEWLSLLLLEDTEQSSMPCGFNQLMRYLMGSGRMVYTEATGDQPEDIQNASCVFITKPCAETTANQQVDANLCLCVYDSKTLDKK